MCTATPSSGTQMCWPMKCAALRNLLDVAVQVDVAFGSSRVPLLANTNIVPMPPSMSIQESALRGAGAVRQRVELVLEVEQALAERLQHRRPFVKGHGPQRRPADAARVIEHRRGNRIPRSRPPRSPRPCWRRAARSRDRRPPASAPPDNSAAACSAPAVPRPASVRRPRGPPASRQMCLPARKRRRAAAPVSSIARPARLRSAASLRAPSRSPIVSAWNIGPPR